MTRGVAYLLRLTPPFGRIPSTHSCVRSTKRFTGSQVERNARPNRSRLGAPVGFVGAMEPFVDGEGAEASGVDGAGSDMAAGFPLPDLRLCPPRMEWPGAPREAPSEADFEGPHAIPKKGLQSSLPP